MALLLVVVKVLATSITIGSGGSGGIFAPSLLIGASLGGAFGMIVHGALPGLTSVSGAYAVAGMGAVVAAATRGPITAIAIIFEMTGDYKIILPIMTACIIASLVAARLSRHSIYTLKLARRGVHLDEGLEPSLMRAAKVRDVMDQQAPTLPSKAPLAEVLDLTSRSRLVNHYVLEPDGRVKGVMSIHEVKKVINQPSLGAALIAEDLADESIPTVTPDGTLAEAIDVLFSRDLEELTVVDEEGKFLGAVSKHGILDLYQREALQEAGKGLKVIHRDDQTMRLDYIEMGEGHGVVSVPASAQMAGKTLEQLRLRRDYRVNVVAIRSARTGASTPPTDPRRVIDEGDILVVMGTEADIQRMKKSLHIEG